LSITSTSTFSSVTGWYLFTPTIVSKKTATYIELKQLNVQLQLLLKTWKTTWNSSRTHSKKTQRRRSNYIQTDIQFNFTSSYKTSRYIQLKKHWIKITSDKADSECTHHFPSQFALVFWLHIPLSLTLAFLLQLPSPFHPALQPWKNSMILKSQRERDNVADKNTQKWTAVHCVNFTLLYIARCLVVCKSSIEDSFSSMVISNTDWQRTEMAALLLPHRIWCKMTN
jgi:hypothetical protein